MASRLPRMIPQTSLSTTPEGATAPGSNKPELGKTPPTAKKGIPCAPTAAPPPSKKSSVQGTRLPGAPPGFTPALYNSKRPGTRLLPPVMNTACSSVGEPIREATDGDDLASALQPSCAVTLPSTTTTTPGLQLVDERPRSDQLLHEHQPCSDCTAVEVSSRTTAAGDDANLSCSSSGGSTCGSCSSFRSSSSCSLSVVTFSDTATTSSHSFPGSPRLSAASSFTAERPTSTSQVDQGPHCADTQRPPCCAPAASPSAAAHRPVQVQASASAAAAASSPSSSSSSSSLPHLSASGGPLSSQGEAFIAAARVAKSSTQLELIQMLKMMNEIYEILAANRLHQVQRLSDALATLKDAGCRPSHKAPAPAPAAPAPASPPPEVVIPAPTPAPLAPVPESDEESNAAAAATRPAEETAKPSGVVKRKFGKVLRGLFGSCMGRNVVAL